MVTNLFFSSSVGFISFYRSGAVHLVPKGWAVCDGTKGTPDLRDRFVIGSGNYFIVF